MSEKRVKTQFVAGSLVVEDLRRAAQEHGAGEAELAAIGRLAEFQAERVDVERLEPLAKLAGLDWLRMYPEVFADREMKRASELAAAFLELTAEEPSPTPIVCTALALAMLVYENAAPVEGYTTTQSIAQAFEMALKIKAQVPT